ncbi:hypothetical protein [Herbiconiux sp. A18JL235]|uniref:Uncharacterized protein n=1 Tax=Herbiconiux sp. A18JL235 TaxID=3152363 RepID=A0AB39BK82_9MICO
MEKTSLTVTWRCAQPGLWIASHRAGAAGIVVERWTEGFEVTSASGRALGTFPRLDDAKTALERAVAMERARSAMR